MSWSSLTNGDTYKSPAFIALVSALCVAIVLLLHHCVVVVCCRCGGGGDRRRRRQHHHRHVGAGVVTTATGGTADARQESDDDDASISVEVSAATSRTHLVAAAAVVCRYRKDKEEAWRESTCPVCLADFDDGEPVRVLPECMHYFHAECIDTWLRGGSTSCPMCRAETTPTPSHTHTPSPAASVRHHLELSVSLEEILVRT